MRHVTDGELHAFLDGALDLLPDRRGEEVRAHVLECPACRERLQDEESVRSRAAEILGEPEVRSVALPTFEELRGRAEARNVPEETRGEIRYRGPLRGMPLAWAATVVLALGVGWMGGQVWRTVPRAGNDSSSDTNVVDRDSVSPALEMAQYRAGPSGAAASTPASEPGAGDVRSSGGEAVPPPTARAAVPTVSSGEEAREAVALEQLVAGGEGGRDTSVVPVGAARPSKVDPSAPSLPVTVPRSAPQLALEEEVRATPLERELQEPTLPDEKSFAVPGLKLLSVEWEEWLPGERVLRIRQLLSMGDTLELRYLGLLMGTEPTEGSGAPPPSVQEDLTKELPLSPAVLEASLPPGWNQVEMRWGRGWLVARAPLPEESIKALLRSLR